jgi:hypothetical protein
MQSLTPLRAWCALTGLLHLRFGAVSVQAQAGELEDAIRQRRSSEALHAMADQLRSTLQPLVQAIQAWLPAEPAKQAAVSVDEVALQQVCARLRELCAEMDSGAEDLLSEHDALLRSAFPGRMQALVEAIRGFDFDLAVAQLDGALQARRIDA